METKLKYQSMIGSVREVLTASRTYYVRTDGNDTNTGLANTAAGAFQTIQRAVDVVATLDINAQAVTVQVAAGTYGPVNLRNVTGFAAIGNLTILGDQAAPSTVVIDGGANYAALSADGLSTVWYITGVRFTGVHGVVANGSHVRMGVNDFYNVTYYQCLAMAKGLIYFVANYYISGAGNIANHWAAIDGGQIYAAGITVTINANLTFGCFASAGRFSLISCHSSAFSKGAYTVTCPRYGVSENSVIFTNGGGASYLPGTAAGAIASGGQYV